MFLLVMAHPGCPRQNPKSHKTVVCVYVSQSSGQFPDISLTAVKVRHFQVFQVSPILKDNSHHSSHLISVSDLTASEQNVP